MKKNSIVEKTAKDIKSLKIQGASKVLEMAVKALTIASIKSTAKTKEEFRVEFLKNAMILYKSRPTEPAMRNAIRVMKQSISKKDLTIIEMKKIIDAEGKSFFKNKKITMGKIAEFGANMIKPGAVIMTICHSHSVIDVLLKAKKKIKKVYCLETRPLFQGRITAKELASAGIDVTLIVDNAASTFLKECDYFFSGADAFLADGDVINKIGTNQVSTVCRRYDTKHYVVCSTKKFSPATFFGFNEPIEERSTKELGEKISKVKVINPAFDRTDATFIEGIICEKGIFSPKGLANKLYADLNLENREKEFFKL